MKSHELMLHHQVRSSSTNTLVELSHAAFGHGRVVSSVDLCNVIALNVLVSVAVHSQEAGKGDLFRGEMGTDRMVTRG